PAKIAPKEETKTPNEIPEVRLDLEGTKPEPEVKPRKNAGIFFVILGIVLVIAIILASVFFDTGMDDTVISPLTVNGKAIPGDDFSFMYHYELLQEGFDIFASDAQERLSSAYPDDDNFATYRDYFLNLAATDIQRIEILYDDATEAGFEIEQAHYDRANAYINYLRENAEELGVPLDTYIKGVFGSQVDEQCIVNFLAKKYFTEDYANSEKLVQLSATDEQAEEAYLADRNSYDIVSYKILRITYEQREQAFIDTANNHAQQIIDKMAGDASQFEEIASHYFSGVAANTLEQEDSTLVPDQRYQDIAHADFRDWLFDEARNPGDATIFADEDGFPIILVFVERERMTTPLRNLYLITVGPQYDENFNVDMGLSQSLAQEIYDFIDSADTASSVENLYNNYVLDGSLTIQHNEMAYMYEYQPEINDWIFAEERALGDKTLIELDGTFYILYYISESENPEWYDRVNSFIRMNNYQEFINAKSEEYTWSFNDDGLTQIKDIP
ncbi:MAG: hypothetical protein K5745_08395, partial [Saccharofermentans sp.]|nr:hypothetical protein [Saccharofermentans sp.]